MKKLHIQYNSPVVLSFALLSLAALLLGRLTGGWTTHTLFCVYRAPLTDPFTYIRMVGHVLGHAGYAHYISKMTVRTGPVPLLSRLRPAGGQRHRVYDDRAVLSGRNAGGRHPPHPDPGSFHLSGGRDRGRRHRAGQRVPTDPHCGRSVRSRAGLRHETQLK